jgi:GINS complex subunit 3
MQTSRYFSLEEIIAEDEKVPVQWRQDVAGVAWLDSSLVGSDVKSKTQMDLPLWLADELKHMGLADVHLPDVYTRKTRDNIKADAVSAKLRELSPHFYSVGLQLGHLLKSDEESKALSKDVHQVLADRAAGILQKARTGVGIDVSRYRGLLTDLEQQIFDAASAFTAAKLSWRREEAGMMRPPAAALGGMGGGGAGSGGQVTSVEASLLQSSVMPQSRGQKKQKSLLSTSGVN